MDIYEIQFHTPSSSPHNARGRVLLVIFEAVNLNQNSIYLKTFWYFLILCFDIKNYLVGLCQ